MKIAVLSDVHGNVPALAAVLDDIGTWRPDAVIVNGDLVSRGPYSLRCLQMIRLGFPAAYLLSGNHETFVIGCVDDPPDPESPTYALSTFATWTASQLGDEVEGLRGWRGHLDLTGLDGGASVHVTHGSRLGNRDGIRPETSDAELVAKLGDPCDLFVGSHTHRPLLRRFQGNWVVNTGSVGQPLDGDPRAAYGRCTYARGEWSAEIVRVAFDRAQASRDFVESGFLDACGPIARVIFRELRDARMHVGPMMWRYLTPIKAGEISVADAVERYLERHE
ncbi:MAG: metallophosphoesterase family protein [Thiotrichales bacterium]